MTALLTRLQLGDRNATMLNHLSGLQALAYLSTGYFNLTGGVLARHSCAL
jgi:hypothetical protein